MLPYTSEAKAVTVFTVTTIRTNVDGSYALIAQVTDQDGTTYTFEFHPDCVIKVA